MPSSEQLKLYPSTENGKIISQSDFQKIDPQDLEIYVVKPVKKIVSVLSHVVIFICCDEYFLGISV